MIHLLRTGDKVKIWPMPGARVKTGPDAVAYREVNTALGRDIVPTLVETRLLKPEGETVEWSAWWLDLAKHNAIAFTDPRPDNDGSGGVRKAVNVRHPHEVGADGKTALESGPSSEHEAAHWVALGVLADAPRPPTAVSGQRIDTVVPLEIVPSPVSDK